MSLDAEWFPVDKLGTFWIYGIPGTEIDFAVVYATGCRDHKMKWRVCWRALRLSSTSESEVFDSMWAAAQWCVE